MPAEDRNRMYVLLTCRSVGDTARFYCEKLGFSMKESWPDKENPQWANLVLDGQSVMVGAAVDPEKVGEMCAGAADTESYWKEHAADFRDNKPGVGVQIYLQVEDVDAYYTELGERTVEVAVPPKTQFYGIRDFAVNDPEGYRLVFFSPVAMSQCQSCGMPLSDARPGQIYCTYCTDASGAVRPYETVFEGTVTQYFMRMLNMPRSEAEKAAREHLAKMPAWAGRS